MTVQSQDPRPVTQAAAQLRQLAAKHVGYGMSCHDDRFGRTEINLYGPNAKAAYWLFENGAPVADAIEAALSRQEASGEVRERLAPFLRHTEQCAYKRKFEYMDDKCRCGLDEALNSALSAQPLADAGGVERASFQSRVHPWMMECFGAEIAADRVERGDRLLEEVLELLQSGGYNSARVHSLVAYVWGRPAGEPDQEVGGVMVTLAAYCLAHGLNMHEAGERELARINAPETIAKIRAKQAAKPTGSALPIPSTAPDELRAEGDVSGLLLQLRAMTAPRERPVYYDNREVGEVLRKCLAALARADRMAEMEGLRELSEKATAGEWHAGCQNDALYLVAGRPPAPNNDYPWHDAPRICLAKMYSDKNGKLVANADRNAAFIVACVNYVRAALSSGSEGGR